MRPDIRSVIALLIIVLVSPLNAQARWYQVEVVTFRHVGATGAPWEAGAADPRPEFDNVVHLTQGERAGNIAFGALSARARKLDGVRRRLAQSGAYQPLVSAAWRQPSYGVAAAKRVFISDAADAASEFAPAALSPMPAQEVEGTVRIKISRLMHIEVDLVYYHNGQPVRLHETRKAKLRELHYFDHPLFGAIVQVSPFAIAAVSESSEVSNDEPEDPNAVDAAQP